jgi:O-antigen biosynthesis protein WbqP
LAKLFAGVHSGVGIFRCFSSLRQQRSKTEETDQFTGLILQMIKRFFDISMAVMALAVTVLPMLLVALRVRFPSKGPVIYWSTRIGRGNRRFQMPKFRTMRMDTPVVATHLLSNAENRLPPVGGFLRRASLDELPQV